MAYCETCIYSVYEKVLKASYIVWFLRRQSLQYEIVTSFKMALKRWTAGWLNEKTRVTFRLRAQDTYVITGSPGD